MATSVGMTFTQRQALLEQYRKGADPRVRLRAYIILLLPQGALWAMLIGVMFCNARTVALWKSRLEIEGIGAVLEPTLPPAAGLGVWWREVVVARVRTLSPCDFGFLRTRGFCR